MNKNYMRAIPKEWRNIAKMFTALGDEHRQRILLTFEPGEQINISQIVEISTLSRTAVSHHLRVLRESGVLHSVKQGKEVYYSLDKKFITNSLGAVLDYVRLNT